MNLTKKEKYSYFFLAPFYLIMGRYFAKNLYLETDTKRRKQIVLFLVLGLLFWLLVLMIVVYFQK